MDQPIKPPEESVFPRDDINDHFRPTMQLMQITSDIDWRITTVVQKWISDDGSKEVWKPLPSMSYGEAYRLRII
jgi:hypothetical protein